MKKYLIFITLVIIVPIHSKKSKDEDKPQWAKKGNLLNFIV